MGEKEDESEDEEEEERSLSCCLREEERLDWGYLTFQSSNLLKFIASSISSRADDNGSFARQFPLLFLGHLHHVMAPLHIFFKVAGLDFEPRSGSIYQIPVWRMEVYKGSRGGVQKGFHFFFSGSVYLCICHDMVE
ncbi:hypothetical protein COP1_044255 [Malus domestica]